MKYLANLMNLLAGIAAILVMQSFQPSDLLESKMHELSNKLISANHNYPAENIYLHIDRPSYWANDDIWFKAYLESKVDSSNIYVELISPSGRILQKKTYLAIDGLAYGDFHLPDTTSNGVYQIRSYTNYMRNFDESSFFHQNIIVWNIKNKEIRNEKEDISANGIDLLFFPESGTLLSGVKSKLGFKAVDENGIGIDVSGTILDDQGIFVTFFKSLYKGMGSFEYVPQENKKYIAILSVNGKETRFDLPKPEQFGVSLAIETTLPEELRIKIIRNPDESKMSENNYFLIGQTRGNLLFEQAVDLSDGICGLKINKEEIPTGVMQITLFDSNLFPQCERLVFINHNDYVHLDIQTNKTTYSTRNEVLVNITSFLKDSMPVISNLSLSAFSTENQLKVEEYPNNILSHFLLNSDLKGRIEEPAYYFKDNKKATLMALDNLMLTQGWRRFSWQSIVNNSFTPLTFEHQSSISLSGKVSTKLFEKPLPNIEVTLFFDQQGFKYYQQNTDSVGRFNFNSLYFFNKTSVRVQAKKENSKNNIWMEIDKSSEQSPVIEQVPVAYVIKNEQKVNTTFDVSIKDSNIIQRKWHISDTILLNDIDIFGKQSVKTLNEALFAVPNPDRSAIINHEEEIASTIFDYIQFNMPGVYIEDTDDGSKIFRIGMGNGAALILLDGMPTEIDWIESMSFSDFDRIDAQRYAPMYGRKGNNGVINFTTRRGIQNIETSLPAGVERINLQGYAIIREYYSPNYSNVIRFKKPISEVLCFGNLTFGPIKMARQLFVFTTAINQGK